MVFFFHHEVGMSIQNASEDKCGNYQMVVKVTFFLERRKIGASGLLRLSDMFYVIRKKRMSDK